MNEIEKHIEVYGTESMYQSLLRLWKKDKISSSSWHIAREMGYDLSYFEAHHADAESFEPITVTQEIWDAATDEQRRHWAYVNAVNTAVYVFVIAPAEE